MLLYPRLCRLFAAMVISAPLLFSAEFTVNSDGDLRDLFDNNQVQPGDTIIWEDGTYTDQEVYVLASGEEGNHITLKAETPGGVIFRGESQIRFGGNYITIQDFLFYNGDDYFREVNSSLVQFRSNSGNVHAHHCRLTNCAFIDVNSWEVDADDDDDDGDTTELIFHNSKWIQIYGTNNRVDHCHFSKKIVRGALIIVEMVPQDGENGTPYDAYNHRIDRNFFGPNPVGWSSNEFETIRVGTSDYANFNGQITVENNYFLQCDGEIEVISNKSSYNTYRNNVLVGCKGSIVVRHGDYCTVENNIILGRGRSDTGGIRINGEGHVIRNNYIEGVQGTGLRAALTLRAAGSVTGDDTNGGYEQVRFAEIEHNTIINSRVPFNLVELGGKDNSQVPTSSVIANNLVYSTLGTLVTFSRTPQDMTYSGNVLFGSTAGISDPGFIVEDPLVERRADWLYQGGVGGAAAGTADAGYTGGGVDLDGEARPLNGADVGAHLIDALGEVTAAMDPFSAGPTWFTADFEAGFDADLSVRASVLSVDLVKTPFLIPGTYSVRRGIVDGSVARPVVYEIEDSDDGSRALLEVKVPDDVGPVYYFLEARPTE